MCGSGFFEEFGPFLLEKYSDLAMLGERWVLSAV
jgi:hypothetical protein